MIFRIPQTIAAAFVFVFLVGAYLLFPVVGRHSCEVTSFTWKGWSESGNYVGRVYDAKGNTLPGVVLTFTDYSGGDVVCVTGSFQVSLLMKDYAI